MERQIDEATKHGVNVFICDWYWFDNRPFLEQCLNDGFLGAKNRDKMKFYLMWANHDATHYWNIDLVESQGNTVIWQGGVKRDGFETVARRVIEKYFKQPNYYTINGCPVFMIYDVNNLVNGLGGLENTQEALAWFREETKKAGFPDLHLQLTLYGEDVLNLSGFDANMKGSTKDVVSVLGADSVSHYQFLHFTNINRDYLEILKDVEREWARIEQEYTVPYFPHISCGWDNNPRFHCLVPYATKNNTPENLRKAMQMAKDYLDKHVELSPLVTVNSWNEWTETSYLQPDNVNGYGYLEAIRSVFVEEK